MKLKINSGTSTTGEIEDCGGEKPQVKLEPSVGQETRFGCEGEDFVALEKTS